MAHCSIEANVDLRAALALTRQCNYPQKSAFLHAVIGAALGVFGDVISKAYLKGGVDLPGGYLGIEAFINGPPFSNPPNVRVAKPLSYPKELPRGLSVNVYNLFFRGLFSHLDESMYHQRLCGLETYQEVELPKEFASLRNFWPWSLRLEGETISIGIGAIPQAKIEAGDISIACDLLSDAQKFATAVGIVSPDSRVQYIHGQQATTLFQRAGYT